MQVIASPCDPIARLNLSESGFGCSPWARQAALDEADRLNRYPDGAAGRLVAAIAGRENLTPDHVIVGNGIDELLLISALALVDPSVGAIVGDRTYPGHVNAVRAARHTPIILPLRDLRMDTEASVSAMRPRSVVYVCNPHNPTGVALDPAKVEYLARVAHQRGAVLVVDEAYIEFTDPDEATSAVTHVRAGLPVIVLRTFSKIHGLAGLRCGYAMTRPDICDQMRRLKDVLVFNVNRVALAAAEASLADIEFIDVVRGHTRTAVRSFEAWLTTQPWAEVNPSVTNFTLVKLPWPAHVVSERLAVHGVLVRDLTDMGWPDHVRISAGHPDEMGSIRTALEKVAQELETG
jgi:histidinol-phosphate aminotransferase